MKKEIMEEPTFETLHSDIEVIVEDNGNIT